MELVLAIYSFVRLLLPVLIGSCLLLMLLSYLIVNQGGKNATKTNSRNRDRIAGRVGKTR